MHIVIIILLTLLGLIVLLFILAHFMKKEHYVKREITIHASAQKAFDFLKFLKNQDRFNKWATADKENRMEEFMGTDGTVGFIYAWSGNKSAGKGEKEIIELVESKKVETEIRFTKPMKVSARVIFEMEPLSGGETKVSLINKGNLPYPVNIMIPLAEKNFAKDMDHSLLTLKTILEKE